MVVRNCAATLEPLLESLHPYVDQFIIGLGGKSDDGTEKIARKYADVLIPCNEFFPESGMFDFAGARNSLLPYVTGEYVGWCDGDDAIEGVERLPETLDAMDKGIDRCDMEYQYAFDDDGNLLTSHQRERILRTSKDWHWMDRVHETANTNHPHRAALDDTIKIVHKRNGESNASDRNYPILMQMMEEDPKPRTLIHLAHACFSKGQWEEAISYYEQYMSAPENDVSQWSAAIMGARCAVEIEDWLRVQSWAMLAAGICPQYSDAYVLLAAATWHSEHDVKKTEAWLQQANAAEQAPLAVFRMPLDNQSLLWDIEHRVFATNHQWAEALAVCERALVAMPKRKEWLSAAQFYRECVFTERSRMAALQLADHMIRHGDVVRAKGLLENFLPSTIRDDPAVLKAKARVYQFLNTEGNQAAYEDADHFDADYPVHDLPRVMWMLERLRTVGAKRVLEVGCHIGLISRYLASQGFECVGVDFNENMVKIANERAQKEGVNARFVAGRLEDIKEKFDAVIFAEILEHVTPTIQMAMLNYAETLAPTVMGSVPAEPIGACAGLWEKSEIGAETYRPHIFEFDQNDMETLILTEDRRIINCHKIPYPIHPIPGFGNRVFEFNREPQEKKGLGIAFVLGPGHEMWTPLDIEGKGIGGSETAAVRLADEFSKRGHYVTVYGPEEGVYNGVVYRHWQKYDPTTERDVVIVSRELAPLQERPNASIVMLWCHDIAYNDGDFTEEIAGRVDKIVLMSEWQKGYWQERYPWLADEKLVVAGNAIIPYDVSGVERIRGRFIYSSSPDRGLDDLLIRWPLIKEMCPEAELHVFYGWQYLDTVPQLRAFKQNVLALSRQEGVFMHGRVGQRELAKEFAKAQFWLYPSMLPRQPTQLSNGADFHETFCISAVEAQMYGCIPITRAVGALSERLTDMPTDQPSFFVEPWVTGNILQRIEAWDGGTLINTTAMMRMNAEQYTWKAVGDAWLTAIAGLLIERFGEVEEVPVT